MIKVTVTKWLFDKIEDLSDEEIIKLINEDIIEFIDNAEWKIERSE